MVHPKPSLAATGAEKQHKKSPSPKVNHGIQSGDRVFARRGAKIAIEPDIQSDEEDSKGNFPQSETNKKRKAPWKKSLFIGGTVIAWPQQVPCQV